MKNTILFFVLLLTVISAASQVRISEMPALIGEGDSVWVPVIKNGQNYKMQGFNLKSSALFAQTPSAMYVKTTDIVFPQDTIRYKQIGGAMYRKFVTGVWQMADFGIKPSNSSATNTTLLQAALNRTYVRELQGGEDSISAYRYTGKLNGNGKVISFFNGAFLLGTGTTDTLDNAIVRGNGRMKIFQNVRLTKSVQSDWGFFPWMWNGVHPDSTSDANMEKILRWTAFTEEKSTVGGAKIMINNGQFMVKRYGAQLRMIHPGSNSYWAGESPAAILKVDVTVFQNFARVFYIGDGKRNITIDGITFDGSNFVPHYDSIPSMLGVSDAQCAFVMTYSSDSTNPVRDITIKNCAMRNPIGECINISRNTRGANIENILMGGYLRQGLGAGGGGVYDLNAVNVKDIEGETYVCPNPGGTSIHSEPTTPQYNLNFSNCVVNTFSLANVIGGSCVNVKVKDPNTPMIFNFVADYTVTACQIFTTIQCTPQKRGNLNFINNPYVAGGITFTSVAGYPENPKFGPCTVAFNNVYGDGILINIVDSVNVDYNHVFVENKVGITFSNQASGRCTFNEVVNSGNNPLIYAYSTQTGHHGKGMVYFEGNYGRGTYRGLQLSNKSAIIGPHNTFDVPTQVSLLNSSKLFPYIDGAGRRVLNTPVLPTWGLWTKGDIISLLDGDSGDGSEFVVNASGALHEGYWISGSSYSVNDFVVDTGRVGGVLTTRYYKSTSAGGGAERPFDDTDNTYWQQISTTAATLLVTKINGIDQLLNAKVSTGISQTHTTGTSVVVNSGVKRLFIDPASALASLTVTLPIGVVDGDRLDIFFGGTMSAGNTVSGVFNVSPGVGSGTVNGGGTPDTKAGTSMTWIYKAANATWYRLTNNP
ncbi:MAG: hypothetical protein ACTHLE_04165 [Agriterribacter sp.]